MYEWISNIDDIDIDVMCVQCPQRSEKNIALDDLNWSYREL